MPITIPLMVDGRCFLFFFSFLLVARLRQCVYFSFGVLLEGQLFLFFYLRRHTG